MSEFFATAEVLVVPNTAEFAASLKAQLTTAIAAAGPVVVPVTAAPAVAAGAATTASAELAAANKTVAASSLAVADAATIENAVVSKTAVVEEAAAVATISHARAANQAERAIGAQAASIAGLRGAALTASAPFLLATVAVIAFGKSIKEASDQTEELNKSAVVFGQSSQQIKAFADTTAASLGISSVQALRAAGIFGNLFRTIKISEPVSAAMSQRLVTLAADLASFNNADPSRTLEALRSGLVGQARPLRVFGIFISQARAQQEALIATGKKNVKQLTNSELVQARYNIILKDSALASGDFARTSDRLANQARILKASLADLAGELGTAVIPGLLNLASTATDVFKIFKDFKKIGTDFNRVLNDSAKSLDKSAGSTGFFAGQLKEAETAFGRILIPGKQLRFVFDHAAEGADRLAGTTNAAVAATERASESLPVATTRIAALAKAFQEGGGRGSTTALNQFIVGLQKLQAEESSGLITNDQLAGRIANLIKQLQDPSAFNIDIKAVIDARGLAATASQASNAALSSLQSVLSPTAARAIGLDFMDNLGAGANAGAAKAGADAGKTFVLNLSSQVSVAQATGNEQQTLSALRARLAKRKAFLASLLSGGRQVTQALIQRAAANVEADNSAIQAILDSQASANQAAATKAKDAAKNAQDARDKQFQALADVFGGRQSNIQDAIGRAGDNVGRQISLTKALIASFAKERKALLERLNSIKVSAALRKQILNAITSALKQAKEDKQQLEAQQKQAIEDTLTQKLDLRIQLAEATGNVVAQVKAHRAKLAEINKEIKALEKAHKKNTVEWLQLKVDQANERKAINDLTKESKKTQDATAAMQFQFLQTQSGFAANLLGNLIPGGATGGLVGGTTGSGNSPTALIPRQVPGGFEQPRSPGDRVRADSATAAGGPTRGGQATQNQLLRHIVKLLNDIYRGTGHPEAKHRQNRNLRDMDLSNNI